MSNLEDLMNNLATDSYRTIFLDDNGSIEETRIPQVLNAANEALQRIYARAQYKKREVVIILDRDISHYPLEPKYSISKPGAGITKPFIQDTIDEPFNYIVGNIYKAEDMRCTPQPLNNSNVAHPINVTDLRVLHIPRRKHLDALRIFFTEAPPKLTSSDLSKPIPLPDELLGAMQAYMGYYIFRGTPTETGTAMSSMFLNEYNSIMTELSAQNTLNTSVVDNTTNFQRNGWA